VSASRLVAWILALTLVALPIVGVLNGWFASDRWPVTRLAVAAEFNHVSAEQIRGVAEPLLGAGFFAIDLDRVRDAVARLPWVERVEARKRWPDTVDLVVYEQQAYARWGERRLVNRRGGLFEVAGADGLQGLPRLSGPDDRLDDVLRFHAECLREVAGSGLVVEGIALTPRGGWRIELASGTSIELGRAEPAARLKRFLDVWPRLAGTHDVAPAYVDLRYANGFAVRWAGEAADEGPGPEPREGQGGAPQAGDGRAALGLALAAHLRAGGSGPEARIADRALPESRIPTPESPLARFPTL